MFLNIEKNRVNDDKCIISHFIHSELKYHCAAIQKLSELFSHINKTNVNTGLVKFADDYGIKNFNFKDLGIDMDELKKSKLKKEEEENKKKKSVFEEDNKNEEKEKKNLYKLLWEHKRKIKYKNLEQYFKDSNNYIKFKNRKMVKKGME